jgi:hypothetical protein
MKKYEKAGKTIRFLGWLSLASGFLVILIIAIPNNILESSPKSIASFLPLLFILAVTVGISILQLNIGRAIQEHKNWGRVAGIILGIVQLFGFPIGTIIGVYILWCLIKGWDLQYQ